MVFAMFDPNDPEQAARFAHAQDMANMTRQELSHRISSFLDDRTEEELETLHLMFQWCDGTASGDNSWIAIHMMGRIQEILRAKFNVCSCGQDHNKGLADLVDKAEVKPGDTPTPDDVEDVTAPVPESYKGSGLSREDYKHALKNFNVLEAPLGTDPRVYCATPDCGNIWSDINDRMMSPSGKGGCPHCAHKEKFG